jgi:hypothetical protein
MALPQVKVLVFHMLKQVQAQLLYQEVHLKVHQLILRQMQMLSLIMPT